MRTSRYSLALILTLLLPAAMPNIAVADDFPKKPIRLVLPLAPGGITDTIARIVGQKFLEATGQPLLIDNRPGAGGIVASEAVARAPADGYTLLMGNFATHSVTPTLFDKLSYDLVGDFAPISLVASSSHILMVASDVPAKDIRQLVAYGKTPGVTLNYASSGVGSPLHLAGELFAAQTGLQATHVPYKSSAPAIADMLSGRVQYMFDNLSTALPQVRSGKLRAIAQTGMTRSTAAPDIPTMAEAGLPGFQSYGWWGILAPSKTPPEVLNFLNMQLVRILQSSDVREKLDAQGADAIGNSRQEFATFIGTEIRKWAPVIKSAGLTPN
jgi:tripartite-type tricarboxylate transporter receptor subunit TctC